MTNDHRSLPHSKHSNTNGSTQKKRRRIVESDEEDEDEVAVEVEDETGVTTEAAEHNCEYPKKEITMELKPSQSKDDSVANSELSCSATKSPARKSKEEEYHQDIIAQSFENEQLIPKNLKFISESLWSEDVEDHTNTFFSKIDRTMICPKPKLVSSEPCICVRSRSKRTCLDTNCLLFACQEECIPGRCPAKESCGNNRIQKRQWKDVLVFDAKQKGLGLKPRTAIRKGEFVIEYLGVAVQKKKLDKLFRMYKNERMLYIMSLDPNLYLDARMYGSLARFINHSCDPNCYVTRWNVRGISRLAIFASRDIRPMEELTLDYKWRVHYGRTPTKCFCGQPNCRGFLEERSVELAYAEKRMEEAALDIRGKWRVYPNKYPKEEIVNRIVKILYDGEHQYYIADVNKYDQQAGRHLVVYKDGDQSWEDLSKETWLILCKDEDENGSTKISKKENNLSSTASSAGIENDQCYLNVSCETMDFVKRKLLFYCEKTFHVQLKFIPMQQSEIDKFNEISKVEWKLTIIGIDPQSALDYLKRNIPKHQNNDNNRLHPMQDDAGNNLANVENLPMKRSRIAFPTQIINQVRNVSRNIKNDERFHECLRSIVVKATNDAFSELVLESSVIRENQNDNEDRNWCEANNFCYYTVARLIQDCSSAARTAFPYFGIRVGILPCSAIISFLQIDNLDHKLIFNAFGKNQFIQDFGNFHKCFLWIAPHHKQNDHDAESGSVDLYIAFSHTAHKIPFSADPTEKLQSLWQMFLQRLNEDSLIPYVQYVQYPEVTRYFPLKEDDNKYFNTSFEQLSKWIFKESFVNMSICPLTNKYIRFQFNIDDIKGKINGNFSDVILNHMGKAKELLQMQLCLFRNYDFRESQHWCFGRKWTCVNLLSQPKPNPSAASILTLMDKYALANTCTEISKIVTKLSFDGNVFAHACIILFRCIIKLQNSFISSNQPNSSTEDSLSNDLQSLKVRDMQICCIYLAIKCQKIKKWTELSELLPVAYKVFFPSYYNNDKVRIPQEELLQGIKRIIATEQRVLDILSYDIFWIGFDSISAKLTEHKIMALPFANNIINLIVSTSPILAFGGPYLWLDDPLGPEYIFYAMAGLFSVDYLHSLFKKKEDNRYSDLFGHIDPQKIISASECISSSVDSHLLHHENGEESKLKIDAGNSKASSTSSCGSLNSLKTTIHNSIDDVRRICWKYLNRYQESQKSANQEQNRLNDATSHHIPFSIVVVEKEKNLSAAPLYNSSPTPGQPQAQSYQNSGTSPYSKAPVQNFNHSAQNRSRWNGDSSYRSLANTNDRNKGNERNIWNSNNAHRTDSKSSWNFSPCYKSASSSAWSNTSRNDNRPREITYQQKMRASPNQSTNWSNTENNDRLNSQIVDKEIASPNVKRLLKGVHLDLIKEKVLPKLKDIVILSSCTDIYIDEDTKTTENIRLEGDWRSVGVAQFLIKCALLSSSPLMDSIKQNLKLLGAEATVVTPSPSLSFVSTCSPSHSSHNPTEVMTYAAQSSAMNVPSESKKVSPLIDLSRPFHTSTQEIIKSSDLETNSKDLLKNTEKCLYLNDSIKSKNFTSCSIPETMLPMDDFARWGLISKYGESSERLLFNLFIFRQKFTTIIDSFKDSLLRTKSTSSRREFNSFKFLLQQWPCNKVLKKERLRAFEESSLKQVEDNEFDILGFSPSALQELQLLYQLHQQAPSAKGHPNFLLPISILFNNCTKSKEEKLNELFIDPFAEFGSITDEKKKNQKTEYLAKGSFLLHEPIALSLNQVIHHLKTNEQFVSISVFKSWFYDLLSAVYHCHKNHFILRAFSTDQIFLSHNGIAKFGGISKVHHIPVDERNDSENSPYTEAPSQLGKKGKLLISEGDVQNPYIAPELLLGGSRYSKQSDVWSLGALMCHLLLSKSIFAHSKDRKMRLLSMFKVVGSPSNDNYGEARKISVCKEILSKQSKSYSRGVLKAIKTMLKDNRSAYDSCSEEIELIDKMLHLDPRKRITAGDAYSFLSTKGAILKYYSDENLQEEFTKEWLHLKFTTLNLIEANNELFGYSSSYRNKRKLDQSNYHYGIDRKIAKKKYSNSKHDLKSPGKITLKAPEDDDDDDELYRFP